MTMADKYRLEELVKWFKIGYDAGFAKGRKKGFREEYDNFLERPEKNAFARAKADLLIGMLTKCPDIETINRIKAITIEDVKKFEAENRDTLDKMTFVPTK